MESLSYKKLDFKVIHKTGGHAPASDIELKKEEWSISFLDKGEFLNSIISVRTLLNYTFYDEYSRHDEYISCQTQRDFAVNVIVSASEVIEPANLLEFSKILSSCLKETVELIMKEPNANPPYKAHEIDNILPELGKNIFLTNFPCIRDYRDSELS